MLNRALLIFYLKKGSSTGRYSSIIFYLPLQHYLSSNIQTNWKFFNFHLTSVKRGEGDREGAKEGLGLQFSNTTT